MDSHETNNSLVEQLLDVLSTPYDPTSSKDGFTGDSLYLETAYRVKEFIDEIPGGFLIYRADETEEIIYANKALLKIFYCDTLEEFRDITGNSFRGVVYSQDYADVENSIAEQISQNQDALDYVEYRIVRKDGKIRWVEDYGHFVSSKASGDIFYVFISDATDKMSLRESEKNALISAKLENEQKLISLTEEYDKERKLINQEHLRRLEVIEGLSVNYDSILYADLKSDKVLPYRLSTRLELQFEKKLQIKEFRWFLGNYVKTWVHPDDRALVAEKTSPEHIRKALGDNPTFYVNYRCVQNGETQYLQLRVVNVGNSKHVSQIVLGCRNIDEEMLQEIKQKQLLQEALKSATLADIAKSTFLSNVTHDMRTPLNAIFGYAELAKKNLGNPDSTLGYVEKIETAGRQILDLIDKALEVSYIESRDFRIEENLCNICDAVRSVHSLILPQAEKKQIGFSLSLSDVHHGEVYCDESKLKQLLSHLCNNAVKYTKCGGKVSLSVTEQKTPSGAFAAYKFTVSDNGIGISKDALERIFEPFERESNTTLSGVYGAGLGLTISRHLARSMGGDITVESSVNKGSTFTVALNFRLKDESQQPPEEELDPIAELAGKKILIVEDNEINLEIETELLTAIGFNVDQAENGKVGLEKIQASEQDEYGLILMDIQMPLMDGIRTTHAIRSLENTALAHIPIIALSANSLESDKRESLEAGMDAHLSKPIDIPLMLETMTEILQQRKAAEKK